MWRNRNFCSLLVGMQNGAATGKQYGASLKIKMELPKDPASPLSGIYPKELKSESQSDTSAPVFIAALFPEAASMSVSGDLLLIQIAFLC